MKIKRNGCLIVALGVLIAMLPRAGLSLPALAMNPQRENEPCSFVQIPEVMEDDEEFLKNPVLRLDTDEDQLNVIRYLEGFDSQKVIVFPVNIKYTDAEGTVRVVICDPHYNTEPGTASVYSVVDMPLNDFYPLATSLADTLIRHSN